MLLRLQVSMNCASARCRRATGPFMTAKREPDSGRGLEVQAERLGQCDMVPGLEAELGRVGAVAALRTPAAQLDVTDLVGADQHALVRQVGHGLQQRSSSPWIWSRRAAGSRARSCTGRPRPSRRRPRRAGPALEHADLLRQAVAPGLQFLGADLDRLRSFSSERNASTSRKGCGFLRVCRRATTPSRSLRKGDVQHVGFVLLNQ